MKIQRYITYVSFASAVLLLLQVGERELLAFQSRQVPDELRTAINEAMADRVSNAAERLELVRQIEAIISVPDDAPSLANSIDEVWLKAKFVAAVTYFRQNDLDGCAKQLAAMRPHINTTLYPELWFSFRSLSAALQLTRGEREESLRSHRELLSGDLQKIPLELVERAQINYAAVLNESGQTAEAAAMYESLMLSALEQGNARSALHAGNNLIALFMRYDDIRAARRALTELKPLLERNPKLAVSDSIHLRELDLLQLEGKAEEAISGYREFIERPEQPSRLQLGAAHRQLADALLAKGEFDEALVHAKLGDELLATTANETTEAKIMLARIHLKRNEHATAIEILDKIDIASELVPSRREALYKLRLEADLRENGTEDQLDMLAALIDAYAKNANLHSESIYDFFEFKLDDVRRRIDEQQIQAQAELEFESKRTQQRNWYWFLSLISIGAVAGFAVLIVDQRRRAERRRLAEQRAQNERLEEQVANKTRELTINLQAQSELSQALERKKRIETIGLLAGNVAHDINNLLQVIANSNQALSSPQATESERAQVLNISNESLRHGSGIIRQLLAYSRQQELAAQNVCVSEYLNESRALLHSAVGDRIELKIDDQSRAASVFVDPSQLTTAILNILSNAADAMPNGGNITITIQRKCLNCNKHGDSVDDTRSLDDSAAPETLNWSSLPPGNCLSLSIKDSGCGMNAEQIARAFEPFFTTKSLKDGTGLGLSSVYGFVKQSGGDIRILSTPTLGTEVQILLPLSEQPATIPETPITNSNNSLENKRILVVEDHSALAESLMMLLNYLKLQAEWVQSGDEAIKRLELDSDFDFVLSDVHMPGRFDGPALTTWIKANHPELPIFLMSGYHEIPPDKIHVPLLPKPFNIRELSSFLTEHSKR